MAMQAANRPQADVVVQFRRAIELQPDYINAYTQLASIALQQKQFDAARELVEQTVRLEPRNPVVHKTLGAVCELQGRLDEAPPHFQQALLLNPDYADAHHELAWLALQQNRFEDARREFAAVVRITPWDFLAAGELGVLVGNLGHLAEARHYLERALWINPSFKNARDNLLSLEQLEKIPGWANISQENRQQIATPLTRGQATKGPRVPVREQARG